MALQKFQLEDHRIFPYIAWVTIILFCIFVYLLTTRLQANFAELNQSISNRSVGTTTPIIQ